MSIPDNSKFERMISNRPPLSILPSVNKRIVSQYIARSFFAKGALLLLGPIFIYKFYVNLNSAPFLKTRKTFNFEADPYSGKVKCTYQDVPNHQHGY